jgi:hypothetical protein
MTKEALKQMVEALKSIKWANSFNDGDYLTCDFEKVEKAIQSGKQALAELESQEPVVYLKPELGTLKHSDHCRYWNDGEFCTCGAIEFDELQFWKNKALAQQEQEPIAWIEREVDSDNFDPDSVTFKKPTRSTDGWEWVALAPI